MRSGNPHSSSMVLAKLRHGMGHMLKWFIPVLVLLVCAEGSMARARPLSKAKQVEYKVKAAYIYNFLRFIDFPHASLKKDAEQIQICLIGTDPFGRMIDPIERHKAKGKALKVVRAEDLQHLQRCSVVFVGRSGQWPLQQALTTLRHSGILTVSDQPRFAAQGGVIGFIIKRDKVRLQVNLDSARREGLKISAKLLEIADIVRDSRSGGAP
ncbi:YfiR family protein [Magnetococcus sp. PR-3]|uniref:YfiR family protein n=1 Tax=Magnetococcus sp. PR-3 TaxID=3120355 RepID=UPI002FCDED5D